ncbi:MAG: zinc-binding alcohol dehydrogenase family protein [Verrucomicrobia bacterium]|nr:MAG: zinc-binding alcohol dehydrogenase family protein [Verrucomicrobiota bacterium]
MKAVGARRFLPIENPLALEDVETKKPELSRPHDLLVEVLACAVNPVDTKLRKNLGETLREVPVILGMDAAGRVCEVGSDVRNFAVGDRVFYAGDLGRSGSNAEYHLVDSRLVAKIPHGLSFADAAALPVATLTAWELLFERMRIDANGKDVGKKILVINGAGGVGSALIPLAKLAGLEVIATASREVTQAWCTQLGASCVLNHRDDLHQALLAHGLEKFPYIVNLYNTDAYWSLTSEWIAPMGTLGLIVEPSCPLHIGDPLKAKCVTIAWEFMAARARFQLPDMARQGRILTDIAQLSAAGKFPSISTRHFDGICAENLRTCHAAMENGSAHGKWVLEKIS